MEAMFNPAVRVLCAVCSVALFIFLAGAPALAESPLLSMSDPTAVYCENLGYTYEIVDGDDGQRGVCVLPDGRRVDAWEFYRGKVAPEYSYCATQGLDVRTKRTDHGSFITECAVCVSKEGWELGTVSEHVALTASVRVRVEVADLPGGSLVEAAIDDFSVSYLSCGDTVTASDDPSKRSGLALRPNSPNPFGPSTVIRYSLAGGAPVLLTIHSASGRVVRTLIDHEHRGEGPHAIRWNGRDDRGQPVAAGAYFYRLDAGGGTLTAKMILLK